MPTSAPFRVICVDDEGSRRRISISARYIIDEDHEQIDLKLKALKDSIIWGKGLPLIFESAEMLAPIAVVMGAVQLVWGANVVGAIRQQQLMLLLSLAAISGLVQFPFAAPIYFCYYVPLLILAATRRFWHDRPRAARRERRCRERPAVA